MDGSTPNFICVGTMSADVPHPLRGSSPLGGGGVKNSKNGCDLIRLQKATFYFYQRCQMWFDMYGTNLRTFWCRTVNVGQGVSTGWAKKFEKFRVIHHFETLRSYISETIKIEACKQRTEKGLSLPYPTVACVWTYRSRDSTGWAKK